MKKLILFLSVYLLFGGLVFASDYHQDGQTHDIVYTIVGADGRPVAGQTVRVAIKRVSDEAYYDWSSSSFKFSGWTTPWQTMNEDTRGGFYWRTITIDVAHPGLVSGDYICIVSNNDAVYGDQQAESIAFDRLENVIKMNR